MNSDEGVKIDRKKFISANSDPVQIVKSVNLKYVNTAAPGYSRKRQGKSFVYINGSGKLKDESELERIKKLVIPPAWENVWICKYPNGHLQATGTDKLGRKQYRYHSRWSLVRNHTKFYRLHEFGKKLPQIRCEIQNNLSKPGYHKEKILAALVSILERTYIRIGNSFYEKLYGSFGLTTLKNRHVNVNGSEIKFSFTGKKGIKHQITLKSKKLANIIRDCKEIPGKELFEYIDGEGVVHKIDSGIVNEFIQKLTGGDFTAKDFRTWAGSVQAVIALKELGNFSTETEMKHKLNEMYEFVAGQLGNTKAVCKKYYVHPLIPGLYEKSNLEKYISNLKLTGNNGYDTGLSPEEKVLMKLLEENSDNIF